MASFPRPEAPHPWPLVSWREAPSPWLVTRGPGPVSLDLWPLVSSFGRLASVSFRPLASGLWLLASGLSPLASNLWPLASDFCILIPDNWPISTVRGPCPQAPESGTLASETWPLPSGFWPLTSCIQLLSFRNRPQLHFGSINQNNVAHISI